MKTPHDIGNSHPPPVALLIPGVGIAYSKAIELLRGDPIFRAYCARAAVDDFSGGDLNRLKDYAYFLHDNLDNQKLSYVVNCSMCDLYQKSGIIPQFVVGYSMGIYPALYAAGYYSFETGLSIVERAFHLISELCSSRSDRYGMGLILGFTENDIRELLFREVGGGVEIAVYNGKRNMVISGVKEKVDLCLERALELGALGIRPILTNHPYHTAFLEDVSHEFSQFLNTLNYADPVSTVLSLIDGKTISRGEVADTIVKAIHKPLHLELVVDGLVRDHCVSICYETGPPESMKKLVRYIHKGLKVHPFEEAGIQ